MNTRINLVAIYLLEFILGVLFLLCIFYISFSSPPPTDTLRHIATAGRGAYFFPQDPFSFTIKGPYFDYEYLSQRFFFILDKFWGLWGLRIFKFWLVFFIFFIIYLSLKKTTFFLRWAVLYLVLVITGPFLVLRPHLLSMLFFTVSIYLIYRKKNLLYFVPPLVLLWANFHPMFIVGGMLVLLASFQEARFNLRFFLYSLGLGLIFLSTDYGGRLFWELKSLVFGVHLSFPVSKLNLEFSNFWQVREKFVYLWYLFTAVVLLSLLYNRKKIPQGLKLLFVFFFFFSFTGVRSIKYITLLSGMFFPEVVKGLQD